MMVLYRKILSWRGVLWRAGLVFGLFLFLRQGWIGWQAIQTQQFIMDHTWRLVAAIGVYVFAYIVQIAAWGIVMHSLGIRLSVAQVWQGYTLSFLPRYIPGTVWGYLSRNEWLAQRYGVAYYVSSVGSVLEVTALLLSACFYIVVYWAWAAHLSTIALGGIVVACLTALWANWYLVPILMYKARGNREQTTSEQAASAQAAAGWRHNSLLSLTGNGLYLLFWGAQGIALLLLFYAIDDRWLRASFMQDLGASTFAVSLSWMIGFLVLFVPAGLGIREIVLTSLLIEVAVSTAGSAEIVAVISRFAIIISELVLLLGSFNLHLQRWWIGGYGSST